MKSQRNAKEWLLVFEDDLASVAEFEPEVSSVDLKIEAYSALRVSESE